MIYIHDARRWTPLRYGTGDTIGLRERVLDTDISMLETIIHTHKQTKRQTNKQF